MRAHCKEIYPLNTNNKKYLSYNHRPLAQRKKPSGFPGRIITGEHDGVITSLWSSTMSKQDMSDTNEKLRNSALN